ncbi:putative membrane protein YdjX (TVP38/TMEM64 family) [Bacillus pakistanensis]|uniref:TVP38/TMEM64 family membrane protein n=1 Tax=Rossellomorea pakistanensis TaxID=992288 RepID=A0ABS2NH12_9BACI|nr:VTT domain-containing protein [Bacillus pakistanensis]MBM7587139.1 putative membrane protein YdjX (TVP38/TMEM64 family) [Bacillus pakistanensis]
MKKSFLIFFYILLMIIGFYNKDLLIHWINDNNASYLPLMLALSILFATIPIIPFTLFAGIMGTKYGIILGFVINWFGGVSAAIFYYLLARYLFADYFKKHTPRFKKINKFNESMKDHAFLAVLIGRLISIIPPTAIHIYSAMNHIPFLKYLLATSVGQIPIMFMLAFGGNQIFAHPLIFIAGIGLYSLFLLGVFFIYRYYFKNKVKFI